MKPRGLALLLALVMILSTMVTAVAEEPKKYEGVTIKWQYYPFGTPETSAQWISDLAAAFKEETGATLEPICVSWEDGLNRVMSTIAANEGVDVTQLAEQWTGQAYSTGAFTKLDDMMDQFGGAEAYFPGALSYGRYDGATYGLPWGGDVRAMYIRQSVLDKAGVQMPGEDWKWSDMLELLGKLKESGVEYPFLTIGSGTQFDVFYFWWYTMLARGGHFTTEDEKTATINTPEAKAALQDIVDLIVKYQYMAPTMAEVDSTSIVSKWINGDAAMIPCWTGAAVEAQAAGHDDVVSQTPPRGEDGTFGAFLAISVQSVYDFSENKEAALAFLEMLNRPEWQSSYNKVAGWLPASVGAWGDEYWSTGWRAPIKYGMENGTALMPGNAHTATICRIMTTHLSNLYADIELGKYDDTSIEKTLAAAEKEVQAELDKG